MDEKYLPFGFGPEEKVSISTIAFQYGWSAARLNSFLYKYDFFYSDFAYSRFFEYDNG